MRVPLYELCTKMEVDPGLITCPTLNLIAEQEYHQFGMSRVWAQECMAKIANSNKKIVITPADEGADSHAAGTNLSLVSTIVFDWLDEVFAPVLDRPLAMAGEVAS